MIRAGLAALALLAADPSAAAGPDSHSQPAESLTRSSSPIDTRREILSEMWQRGILTTDMNAWSPDDITTLLRMRKAEEGGALGLLRRRFPVLKGLVIRDRPLGAARTRLRLTRKGFDKYLGIKSQEALQYFEAKEVETKWAYWLTDLKGNALFDRGSGRLTEAGDALYSRALLSLPTFWKLRTGEVQGNRPVPKELQPPPPPPPPPPPKPAPRPQPPAVTAAPTGAPVSTTTAPGAPPAAPGPEAPKR